MVLAPPRAALGMPPSPGAPICRVAAARIAVGRTMEKKRTFGENRRMAAVKPGQDARICHQGDSRVSASWQTKTLKEASSISLEPTPVQPASYARRTELPLRGQPPPPRCPVNRGRLARCRTDARRSRTQPKPPRWFLAPGPAVPSLPRSPHWRFPRQVAVRRAWLSTRNVDRPSVCCFPRARPSMRELSARRTRLLAAWNSPNHKPTLLG